MLRLLLLGSLLAPPPAYAAGDCESRCSCLERVSLATARESATAIFVGVPVSTRRVDASDAPEGLEVVQVEFRVGSAWKGVRQERVVITTGTGAGDCGFEFDPSRTYLVFAYGDDAGLATSVCTRTAPLDEAAQDVTELGQVTWRTSRRGRA